MSLRSYPPNNISALWVFMLLMGLVLVSACNTTPGPVAAATPNEAIQQDTVLQVTDVYGIPVDIYRIEEGSVRRNQTLSDLLHPLGAEQPDFGQVVVTIAVGGVDVIKLVQQRLIFQFEFGGMFGNRVAQGRQKRRRLVRCLVVLAEGVREARVRVECPDPGPSPRATPSSDRRACRRRRGPRSCACTGTRPRSSSRPARTAGG